MIFPRCIDYIQVKQSFFIFKSTDFSLQMGVQSPTLSLRVDHIINVNSLSKNIRHFSGRTIPVLLQLKCPPPTRVYVAFSRVNSYMQINTCFYKHFLLRSQGYVISLISLIDDLCHDGNSSKYYDMSDFTKKTLTLLHHLE